MVDIPTPIFFVFCFTSGTVRALDVLIGVMSWFVVLSKHVTGLAGDVLCMCGCSYCVILSRGLGGIDKM